jgi:hypothetical protein
VYQQEIWLHWSEGSLSMQLFFSPKDSVILLGFIPAAWRKIALINERTGEECFGLNSKVQKQLHCKACAFNIWESTELVKNIMYPFESDCDEKWSQYDWGLAILKDYRFVFEYFRNYGGERWCYLMLKENNINQKKR